MRIKHSFENHGYVAVFGYIINENVISKICPSGISSSPTTMRNVVDLQPEPPNHKLFVGNF
jgi:hypothetical protein